MSRLASLLAEQPDKYEKLSRKTGISVDRLRQLAAEADATLSELRRISAFFHVEMRDLLPPPSDEKPADLLFRRSGYSTDDISVSALSRKIGYSLELMARTEIAGPWWAGQFQAMGTSYEDAEAAATKFRQLFCGGDDLGPLLSLPRLLADRLGILLFVIQSPRIDGASAFLNGLPFIFVAERFAPRMLFTVAHELGHLIAHHQSAESFAVLDNNSERRRSKGKEFYSHAFASSLLIPRNGLGVTLKKIRSLQAQRSDAPLGDLEILLVARIYGVSFYAAAKRCEDLGLLPKGGAASLDEHLQKEYGSPEKRAESANLPPRPQVQFPKVPDQLVSAAVDKIRAGDISIGKASAILGLSIADLIATNTPTVH